MILLIDTTEQKQCAIAAARNDGSLLKQKVFSTLFTQIEQLLPTIARFFRRAGWQLADISGIAVVRGPGGFSSLRNGIITANTLAYALGVTVVGFKRSEYADMSALASQASSKLKRTRVGSWAVPFYGQEPNITVPKRLDQRR